MYSSDVTEAFAHARQQQLLERAASDRLAREVAPRAVAAAPRRHHSWHPLAAVHTWLAAGQL